MRGQKMRSVHTLDRPAANAQSWPMNEPIPSADPAPGEPPCGGMLVKRHRVSTRIWHWSNAAALLIMLMSGLMIFNAHPRLYWGAVRREL